jgi:hypothetical protein
MAEVIKMQRLGFIHDMLDVKVLILYVTTRSNYALTSQEIYELCYQDDCVSYFDVCTAIPEMVKSGHLQETAEGRFEITAKGREAGELTEDSIAFTVKQKAQTAVQRYNRHLRRSSLVKTQVVNHEDGSSSAIMSLNDEVGPLMTLELNTPDSRNAVRLARLFEDKAENVYSLLMMELLDEESEE